MNSSPYSLNRSYTVDCVPRLPRGAPARSPVLFRTGHTKWRDIHIGDPSNLSKWSLPSNFLHGSFNGPTQEYQRTVHSHAEHPLYSAACGSPEGPGRQRDDECRRRVGNCVEPDLTRAPATSHASPNLSPLSPLRCSPCTVVRPSLCVPPSRAFGAAERREAAAATSALTSPARSLACSALRTLHS